jgi:hypothetical protein
LEIAAAVADAGDEFIAAEKFVIDYARTTPQPTIAGLAAARKEFSGAVAKLTARLRK